MREKAYFHLPGLFEFYELYRMFLPLFREHREYFYDWCEIGSIYGAPADCIWGGGRAGFGENDPEEVLELMQEYGISARLTFSNSLLRQEHLSDRKCNALCRLFERNREPQNGVIIYSELLLEYIKEQYPGLYFVSSTTKVLTDFTQLEEEIWRKDFRYVVPDFRLNKAFDRLNTLSQPEKDKVEFLCNECCWFGCRDRKACYETVSRKNLGENCLEHYCKAPEGERGYLFSKAMENPGFIGINDIRDIYLPMEFSNFKIEGRGLGSALILEFLLYYMTRPEYQIHVREKIYLDGAQLIVVIFHWGNETETVPDSNQTTLGRIAIDEGADLVCGHHPHVLQGIETYKGRNIVYSLGNFCFGGNSSPSDMDTMIYQQTFTIDADGVKKDNVTNIIPCSISSAAYDGYNNYQPTPAEGDESTRILGKINERSSWISTAEGSTFTAKYNNNNDSQSSSADTAASDSDIVDMNSSASDDTDAETYDESYDTDNSGAE